MPDMEQIFMQRETVEAIGKVAQSYVESNGYAWHAFSFTLYCVGIGIIALTGVVAYNAYKHQSRGR